MRLLVFLLFGLFCLPLCGVAQGIENIIVEKYFDNSLCHITTDSLPAKATTYRVFVDMAPGYKMQVVYGAPGQELFFRTSTYFFNSSFAGAVAGSKIDFFDVATKVVALDTWITIGAATNSTLGIPQHTDPDGSVLVIEGLRKSDGMVKGTLPALMKFNIDLSVFDSMRGNLFSTENGGWSIPGGISGSGEENSILIGQFTTDGDFSFALNLQLGSPDGKIEKYVATNPSAVERLYSSLFYPAARYLQQPNQP